jgi:hypothetical protein
MRREVATARPVLDTTRGCVDGSGSAARRDDPAALDPCRERAPLCDIGL